MNKLIRRLRLESLEDRSLLSDASCMLMNGVLEAVCGPGDDVLVVRRAADSQTIELAINDHHHYSFLASEVHEVRLHGAEGDDVFVLDPDLDLPTIIDGGPGEDMVHGGSKVTLLDLPGVEMIESAETDEHETKTETPGEHHLASSLSGATLTALSGSSMLGGHATHSLAGIGASRLLLTAGAHEPRHSERVSITSSSTVHYTGSGGPVVKMHKPG